MSEMIQWVQFGVLIIIAIHIYECARFLMQIYRLIAVQAGQGMVLETNRKHNEEYNEVLK